MILPCPSLLHRVSLIILSMAKNKQQQPKSFEEAIAELEQILTGIESGNVGLEESLTRYERGTFLVQYCRGVLTQAEKQIEQIGKSADGSLTTQPIEEQPQ